MKLSFNTSLILAVTFTVFAQTTFGQDSNEWPVWPIWNDSQRIKIVSIKDELEKIRVKPMEVGNFPEGITFRCDQSNFTDFRKSYQFSYDDRSPPEVDNNKETGYTISQDPDLSSDVTSVCKLKSTSSSIRLTTFSYRFKPTEFPNFGMTLNVLSGIPGADLEKGGNGKTDSAFEVFFTFRKLTKRTDREGFKSSSTIGILGYYWAEENERGLKAPGSLVENYYSGAFFLVPETWMIALNGGKEAEKRWNYYSRNLAQDLQQAFPNENIQNLEILAITLMTDSSDTQASSEVHLSELFIRP